MVNPISVEIAYNIESVNDLFAIRKEVFVEEQGVDPTDERDEYEALSTHLIAFYLSRPAGT